MKNEETNRIRSFKSYWAQLITKVNTPIHSLNNIIAKLLDTKSRRKWKFTASFKWANIPYNTQTCKFIATYKILDVNFRFLLPRRVYPFFFFSFSWISLGKCCVSSENCILKAHFSFIIIHILSFEILWFTFCVVCVCVLLSFNLRIRLRQH